MKHGVKRAYQSAAIVKRALAHTLYLDDKPAQTVNGTVLAHGSAPLMAHIATEWETQNDRVDMHTMPLTRLLSAFLEMDATQECMMRREIIPYAHGDTLRYHAHIGSLLEAQQMPLWGEWLGWASAYFSVPWTITHSIMPLLPSDEVDKAITPWVEMQHGASLLALYVVTHTLTSFIMAAALTTQSCAAEETLRVAWLEHDHQMQQWGEEYEMMEKRQHCLDEMRAVSLFLELIH